MNRHRWAAATLAFALLLAVVVLPALFAQPPGLTFSLGNNVRRPSTYIDARVLAATVAETWTAPTFAGASGVPLVVVFSCTCSHFYYEIGGGTATAPAGDVSDGTASGRNPTSLWVDQAQVLSVVSTDGGTITLEVYLQRGG